MFGLGMNNNGTGLVMASMALADHPRVLLPIIFYNLVQHLAAGATDRIVRDGEAAREAPRGREAETVPFQVVGAWERPPKSHRADQGRSPNDPCPTRWSAPSC
jgi:hypothetical protein